MIPISKSPMPCTVFSFNQMWLNDKHFPVCEFVLAGVVGEGLHHVGPCAQELPVELLDGLRVLHCGLGGPGPRLDVASLLKLEYEPSISDNRPGSQTLKNVLTRVISAF